MPEANKIDWILSGLDPDLVGKMLSLVPGTFQTVDQFVDTAVRFEVAESERKVRLKHRTPRLNAVLSENTPGLITREDFDQHTLELKQIILRMEKKMSILGEPTNRSLRSPPRETDLPRNQQEPRDYQHYSNQYQQQPEYYQRSARDPDYMYPTRKQPQPEFLQRPPSHRKPLEVEWYQKPPPQHNNHPHNGLYQPDFQNEKTVRTSNGRPFCTR